MLSILTSTTVEIILYYLTAAGAGKTEKSTTVEIILYYLTGRTKPVKHISTTVEIILYYLTIQKHRKEVYLQQ